MSEITVWQVASLLGKEIPQIGRRSLCPIRKHTRRDKSFTVFASSQGGVALWKCHSCDPPSNVGDAVGLYAAICGSGRRDAWLDLRQRGFEVPGLRDRGTVEPAIRLLAKPIEGNKPKAADVLPLDQARWLELQANNTGAVELFAASRKMCASVMRSLGVVDVGARTIGFGYCDPVTGTPCRVKIRPLDRKAFWIEPKPTGGSAAKALAPLYLAHDLRRPPGIKLARVVTEGEVDALTLRAVGIRDVVSLPDGASSAGRVDLGPLWHGTAILLVATDSDRDGENAYRELLSRALRMGVPVARVRWSRSKTEAPFKDANDAKLAGFELVDFSACLQLAADEALGFAVNLASAFVDGSEHAVA